MLMFRELPGFEAAWRCSDHGRSQNQAGEGNGMENTNPFPINP